MPFHAFCVPPRGRWLCHHRIEAGVLSEPAFFWPALDRLVRTHPAPCKKLVGHRGKQLHKAHSHHCSLHGESGPGKAGRHLAGRQQGTHLPAEATLKLPSAGLYQWRAQPHVPVSHLALPKVRLALAPVLPEVRRRRLSCRATRDRIAVKASGQCEDGRQSHRLQQKALESALKNIRSSCRKIHPS